MRRFLFHIVQRILRSPASNHHVFLLAFAGCCTLEVCFILPLSFSKNGPAGLLLAPFTTIRKSFLGHYELTALRKACVCLSTMIPWRHFLVEYLFLTC